MFYDGSAYDGGADGAADDAAVAPDKRALPADETQSESFDNVTSYSKGLNGIMVDVRGLPAASNVSAADFDYRAWRGTSYQDVEEILNIVRPRVAVRRGAGACESDRVTLYFPGVNVGPFGTLRPLTNAWLLVTFKAIPNTGLTRPDAFYFGNLPGETGDGETPLGVGVPDRARTLGAASGTAPITSRFDHNRDGRVNALDIAAVRLNDSRALYSHRPPAASAGAGVTRPGDGITTQVLTAPPVANG